MAPPPLLCLDKKLFFIQKGCRARKAAGTRTTERKNEAMLSHSGEDNEGARRKRAANTYQIYLAAGCRFYCAAKWALSASGAQCASRLQEIVSSH